MMLHIFLIQFSAKKINYKMGDKYAQFKQFRLFFEEFVFISSLYEFLNEKNEEPLKFNGHLQFKMTYHEFKKNFPQH